MGTTVQSHTQAEEREAERLAIAAGLGVGEWESFLKMARANLTTEQPAAEPATPRPWTAPLRLRFEDSPLGRASIWDAKDYCLILDARRDIARGFVDAVNQSAAFDAAVKALRRLVITFDIGRDIYWAKMKLPRPNDDDTEPIKEARAALAQVEELRKGEAV